MSKKPITKEEKILLEISKNGVMEKILAFLYSTMSKPIIFYEYYEEDKIWKSVNIGKDYWEWEKGFKEKIIDKQAEDFNELEKQILSGNNEASIKLAEYFLEHIHFLSETEVDNDLKHKLGRFFTFMLKNAYMSLESPYNRMNFSIRGKRFITFCNKYYHYFRTLMQY